MYKQCLSLLSSDVQRSGALTVDNREPNLVNLTEDPQLSEIVVYFLKEGVTQVGRRAESGQSHDIELSGALVRSNHWWGRVFLRGYLTNYES